jgi:Zn-dependent alcohol dehydrogenase
MDKDIPLYVDLFLSGKINSTALIGRFYSLRQINKASKEMESGQVERFVVEM